jgi:hypothetical protein
MAMNLKEYINKAKADHRQYLRNRSAAEVLVGAPEPLDWNVKLEEGGYYSVDLRSAEHWTDIHQWCRGQYGQENYSWSGTRFWFQTDREAMLFALRWL